MRSQRVSVRLSPTRAGAAEEAVSILPYWIMSMAALSICGRVHVSRFLRVSADRPIAGSRLSSHRQSQIAHAVSAPRFDMKFQNVFGHVLRLGGFVNQFQMSFMDSSHFREFMRRQFACTLSITTQVGFYSGKENKFTFTCGRADSGNRRRSRGP